jgi:large subunit ribosomal protein L29
MKSDSLRELSDVELDTKIGELREELFNFRFRLATGQLDNPLIIRTARKNLARALTLQRERDLGLQRGRATQSKTAEDEASTGS